MKSCIRLKFFPISFFSPILWFGGLTVVLQKMEGIYWFNLRSLVFLYITIAITVWVLVMYILKLIYFPQEVKKEIIHPIKINFFSAFPKWLLILSIAFLTVATSVSKVLWIIGASINLIFTLLIFREYINKSFDIKHINPAWFIPVVTNIAVPITWMAIFPHHHHISRFFFSIWLVFWLILFFIIIYRMIFHNPLPQKLLPTLAILMAPPAIGFISRMKLTWGLLTPFSYVLFYLSLFLFLLLLVDIKRFFWIKFYLSWWAYSFPLSAIVLAIILMYHTTEVVFFKYTATVIGILLLFVISLLIVKTIQAIQRKSLCVEEED